MPTTEDFIETLLSGPEFRCELEEEDQRKWETFTLRLMAWDEVSEELPGVLPWNETPSAASRERG